MDQVFDEDNDSLIGEMENSRNESSSEENWQPVFLVVTDRLLLIFSQAPQSPTEWSGPSVTAALVVTRAVLQTPERNQLDNGQLLQADPTHHTFIVRTGKIF